MFLSVGTASVEVDEVLVDASLGLAGSLDDCLMPCAVPAFLLSGEGVSLPVTFDLAGSSPPWPGEGLSPPVVVPDGVTLFLLQQF